MRQKVPTIQGMRASLSAIGATTIIITAILATLVVGVALVVVDPGHAAHAAEVARSSWGHAAAILRAHLWG